LDNAIKYSEPGTTIRVVGEAKDGQALLSVVDQGCGGGPGTSPATIGHDIQSAYAAELPLADDPEALLDHLDQLLLNGEMSAELRQDLLAAVVSLPLQGADARLARVKLAVFLVFASPEYLHQR